MYKVQDLSLIIDYAVEFTSKEPTDTALPLRCKSFHYPMGVFSLDMTSSQWCGVNVGNPGTFSMVLGPEKSHQGKKVFIRQLNKTIVGDRVGEFSGHIPANME